jgi:hypothetical protein
LKKPQAQHSAPEEELDGPFSRTKVRHVRGVHRFDREIDKAVDLIDSVPPGIRHSEPRTILGGKVAQLVVLLPFLFPSRRFDMFREVLVIRFVPATVEFAELRLVFFGEGRRPSVLMSGVSELVRNALVLLGPPFTVEDHV